MGIPTLWVYLLSGYTYSMGIPNEVFNLSGLLSLPSLYLDFSCLKTMTGLETLQDLDNKLVGVGLGLETSDLVVRSLLSQNACQLNF